MEEYYQEDREFFMVLELPKDIRDQVGGGSLFIDLNGDTSDEASWVEEVRRGPMPNFTLHSTKKNWTDAESFCQKEGGHLAPFSYLTLYCLIVNESSGPKQGTHHIFYSVKKIAPIAPHFQFKIFD